MYGTLMTSELAGSTFQIGDNSSKCIASSSGEEDMIIYKGEINIP
jgi:hypothetical protein